MIKIENKQAFGWEMAINGMRNSFDSRDKSDSAFEKYNHENGFIGDEDRKLMLKLAKAGASHGKFLRMIHAQCDITAPLYWWKQYDTYKVGTTANSESTMHTITKRPLTMDDFSAEDLFAPELRLLEKTIEMLNYDITIVNGIRSKKEDSIAAKRYWENIIALLPSCYNQMRTVDLNYAVLREMYHQRKGHRLTEWQDFREWCETLPEHELITEEG